MLLEVVPQPYSTGEKGAQLEVDRRLGYLEIVYAVSCHSADWDYKIPSKEM